MLFDDLAKRKRWLYIQLGVLIIIASMIVFAKSSKLIGSNDQEKLEIITKIKLPLEEISGIAVVSSGEKEEIFAIGDSQAILAKTTLNQDYKTTDYQTIEFKATILAKFHICQSNLGSNCRRFHDFLTTDWEALAVDSKNRTFLLQESTGNVFVFNKNLDNMESLIQLNFDQFLTKSSYGYEQNSLGEGILLLKNGHFLVAKEKHPTALIEFGPKDDKPLGIDKNTILPRDQQFSLPKKERTTFEPLKIWTLSDHAKCDASDITIDSDGHLYVLSQKCKNISIYKGLSLSTSKLKPQSILKLPRKVKNPEAIGLFSDGKIAIGSDRKKQKSNIYILKKM